MKRSALTRKTPLAQGDGLKRRTPISAASGQRLKGHRPNDSQPQLFADGKGHRYKPKTCKGCGEDFEPTTGNQAWCTKACYFATATVERICAHCRKTFTRHKHGPITRFCSWRCRDTARYGEKLEVPCPGCGKLFRKQKTNQTWCSQRCAQTIRQRRRKADNGPTTHTWSLKLKGEDTCRNCGRPARHLHHIVPRSKSRAGRLDYEHNGVPLCWDCHRGWHDRCVTIHHDALTDAEFLFAVEHGGVVWVEKNYPDRPVVALLRLDELVNRRQLSPDRPLSVDERSAKVLGRDIGRDEPAEVDWSKWPKFGDRAAA